jgi:hypothetical protein
MQQSERIELIKAAAMLTAASMQTDHMDISEFVNSLEIFDYYYDYLQLKLEASNYETK